MKILLAQSKISNCTKFMNYIQILEKHLEQDNNKGILEIILQMVPEAQLTVPPQIF